MNKELFKKAMVKYSKETGIPTYMLIHYLTDGRLIGILKIYDKLTQNTDKENKEVKNES